MRRPVVGQNTFGCQPAGGCNGSRGKKGRGTKRFSSITGWAVLSIKTNAKKKKEGGHPRGEYPCQQHLAPHRPETTKMLSGHRAALPIIGIYVHVVATSKCDGPIQPRLGSRVVPAYTACRSQIWGSQHWCIPL